MVRERSLATLGSLANRRIGVVILLGFSSGLPLALTGGTLQAWMSVEGVDLSTIGIFTLVGLPYTLKFFWAPLLDRFSVPDADPRIDDLPPGLTMNASVDSLIRRMILDAIADTGSKTRAAKRLGIPRQSLQKMMKRLGLQD